MTSSREQFESRYPVPQGVEWNPESNRYALVQISNARNAGSTIAIYEAYVHSWGVWKACRDALAVVMPPVPVAPEPPEDAIDDSFMDGHCAAIRMRNACYLAMQAAGVRVLP